MVSMFKSHCFLFQTYHLLAQLCIFVHVLLAFQNDLSSFAICSGYSLNSFQIFLLLIIHSENRTNPKLIVLSELQQLLVQTNQINMKAYYDCTCFLCCDSEAILSIWKELSLGSQHTWGQLHFSHFLSSTDTSIKYGWTNPYFKR